jgi:hypothetical protein
MKSYASTPVLVHQTIGDGAVYSNFGRNVYVVESHPRAFLGFKSFSSDVGLSFSLLRQFIGSGGLFGGLPDEIIGFPEGFAHLYGLSRRLFGLGLSSNSQIMSVDPPLCISAN